MEMPGRPVVNMWWTHKPKLRKPVPTAASTIQVFHERRARKRRHDHRPHQGDRRQENDVDLRVAEEPEQVLATAAGRRRRPGEEGQ